MAHPEAKVRKLAAKLGGLVRSPDQDVLAISQTRYELKLARAEYAIYLIVETEPKLKGEDLQRLAEKLTAGST